MLPKLTYRTEFSVCLSSHEMQLLSSSNKLLEGDGKSLCMGPIKKSGTCDFCRICASDDCSRQSMLFQIMPDVCKFVKVVTNCRKSSTLLRLKTVKSLNLKGWNSGTNSSDLESASNKGIKDKHRMTMQR